MKSRIILCACVAMSLTTYASRPISTGAAVNHGKCSMILGEPVVGTTDDTNIHHGTYGQIQGLIEVEDVSAAADIVENALYRIYPNPTESILFIDLQNADQACFDLIGLDGHIEKSATLSDSHSSVDLSDLSSGIYLLTIKIGTENKTITAKIIKH